MIFIDETGASTTRAGFVASPRPHTGGSALRPQSRRGERLDAALPPSAVC
jgi:hypothetical protein